MRGRNTLLIVFAVVLGAAFSAWQPAPAVRENSPQQSVGTAEMREDGTVVLTLPMEARAGLGSRLIEYRKDDPLYLELLKRTGGLTPGEAKPVPAWR